MDLIILLSASVDVFHHDDDDGVYRLQGSEKGFVYPRWTPNDNDSRNGSKFIHQYKYFEATSI